MKHLFTMIALAALLLWSCSKKSSGPQYNPPSDTPVIESLSINAGWAGDSLDIIGKNFGNAQDSNTVSFDSIKASIDSWSDTLIAAHVPEGAKTGEITVTVDGRQSNSAAFTVYGIDRIVPDTGSVGNTVNVYGVGFGDQQNSSVLTFNDIEALVSSWSDTLIVTTVPLKATTGDVIVTIGGHQSNGGFFLVTGTFGITSIDPDWGPWGTAVTINGLAFGDAQGTNIVMFNGVAASAIISWSNTMIVAEVPDSATSGDITVATDTYESNGIHFTVFRVNQVIPSSGAIGDTIQIIGEGFLDEQENSTITFDGIEASVMSWSDSLIEVIVPTIVSICDVVITVNGTSSNTFSFQAYAVPFISHVDPNYGTYGTPVRVSGSNFGSDMHTLQFNGIPANVSSWTDTLIETEYPYGCASGDVVVQVDSIESRGVPYSVFGITDISPDWAVPGDTVTVTGTGFEDSQGSNYVKIGDVTVTITTWSDNVIQFEVPEVSSSGNVTVSMDGMMSNAVELTVGSTDDILYFLHQTNYVFIVFKGYNTYEHHEHREGEEGSHTDTCYTYSVFSGIEINSYNGYYYRKAIEWDGDSFSESIDIQNPDCSYYELTIGGTMCDNGMTLSKLQTCENEGHGTVFHSQWHSCLLSIQNVQLDSLNVTDKTVCFENTGITVEDNMSAINIADGGHDECPYVGFSNTYQSTDWGNAEYPPTVTITFIRR